MKKMKQMNKCTYFIYFFTALQMSMRIEDIFDTSLNDPDNEKFKLYANKIKSAVSCFIFCK